MGVNKDTIEFIDDKEIYQEQSTRGFNTGKHATVTIEEIVESERYMVVVGKGTGLFWHQREREFEASSEICFKRGLSRTEAMDLINDLEDLKGE